MPIKKRYTWRQFDKDVKELVRRLTRMQKKFDGVWGPPRGGLPLAVILSHELDIPFLLRPTSARTLIADDIADSGKTLKKFYGKNTIVTIFYHQKSVTIPDVWIRRKGKTWIVFPWEKSTP